MTVSERTPVNPVLDGGITASPRSFHRLAADVWSTKSNSVSYPVQRGAEALYSPEGRKQSRALIEHYMGNAKILRTAAANVGLKSSAA